MKKFLAMTMLLCISMVAMATAQMSAYSPPEQDIGCTINQDNPLMVATLSIDGQSVVTFDIMCNIVDWQTATETITSAQCVDAYTVQTADGCTVGMALHALRWPKMNDEMTNLRNDYTNYYAPDGDAYSFTSSRADFS